MAILGFTSCKEQTLTPGGLVPSIDNIHTFGLEAPFFQPIIKMGSFDSVVTSNYTNYIGGAGMLDQDPFFGSIREGMFVQFRPPTTFYSFPSGLTLDSAVVILPYSSAYGDTSSSTIVSYDLFKIIERFDRTNDYYSFQSKSFSPTSVGSTAKPLGFIKGTLLSADDTLGIGGLKITLDQNLANTIFNADNSKFISPGAFAEFLPGFYVGSEYAPSPQKSILYFKLIGNTLNNSARIAFYTHDSNDSAVVINFPYDGFINPFFTKITKDYTGTPSNSFVNSTANRDSVLIQAFPGLYTELTLNNIDQIPASIVNKAQLIITSLPAGDETIYTPPQRITLEVKNDKGVFVQIADLLGVDGILNKDGLSFVDGKATFITINGVAHTQYKLNFPRELQSAMMTGKSSLTLRIKVDNSQLGVSRFLGDGFNGNAQTKLQTNIIYTKK